MKPEQQPAGQAYSQHAVNLAKARNLEDLAREAAGKVNRFYFDKTQKEVPYEIILSAFQEAQELREMRERRQLATAQAAMKELADLCVRLEQLNHAVVWGGSFEKEFGAAQEAKTVGNQIIAKLKSLKVTASTALDAAIAAAQQPLVELLNEMRPALVYWSDTPHYADLLKKLDTQLAKVKEGK